MGVPTSEVGYTAAMPRREDHEVHKDMWWHWTKKKKIVPKHKSRTSSLRSILLHPVTASLSDSNIFIKTKS
jgi:hypothetical protein